MSEIQTKLSNFCTLNDFQTVKPLPSLDLVAKLIDICHVPNTLFESTQRNIYDRKNYVLHINNFQAYSRTLQQKYGRSVESFQKQLKMLGFKKRKLKQQFADSANLIKEQISLEQQKPDQQQKNDQQKKLSKTQEVGSLIVQDIQANKNVGYNCEQNKLNDKKYMFVWKTTRSTLIEKQLNMFEDLLSQQISRAIAIKQQIQNRKKMLDSKLETIIFANLITENQSNLTDKNNSISKSNKKECSLKLMQKFLMNSVQEVRKLSNDSQIQSRQLIWNISRNLSLELDLYRILIFKESKIHHNHDSIEQE